MKKLILIFSLSACISLLSACGSAPAEPTVSQEDYDSLLQENEQLSSELDEVKSKYLDVLDAETEALTDSLPQQYTSAWATTSFGDSAKCTILDSQLITIVPCEYDYSSESVSTIWDEYVAASKTYSVLYLSDPDSLPDEVTVIFQGSDGQCMLLFSSSFTNGEVALKEIAGNLSHALELMDALSSL